MIFQNQLYDLASYFQDVLRRLVGKSTKDVFERTLQQGLARGIEPGKDNTTRDWFRNLAQNTPVEEKDVFFDLSRTMGNVRHGELYFFRYFAKHHATLPYYDTLPVVFPFQRVKNGFRGLNLHYLPIPARALLMDALYTISSDREMDERTKLNISYKLIDGFLRFELAKPCIKTYLYGQVQSRFVKINSSEWDVALFLQLERFAKGKGYPSEFLKVRAQQDSIRKISRSALP